MITLHILPDSTGYTLLVSNAGEARPLGEFDNAAIAELVRERLDHLPPDRLADLWERAGR